MPIFLGLDTGGTYTDAVLFDPERGVLAKAKALTTKHDLAIGLRGAVEAILGHLPHGMSPGDIALVSISTTLATNAIVEGHGAPVCLILLGYEQKVLERAGLKQALGGDPVVFVRGGHQVTGDAQAPLDLAAVREAVLRHAGAVAAFAVSGYFSVRNPQHEIAVRQLIRELTDKPVSCAHDLTSKLDAPRRALTVTLNARLISELQRLIQAVERLLHEKGIAAPLMVVKGDGSLIDAAMALTCPVETILSGPAASLVGARYLSGEDTIIVSDMGGTTTDIALLRGGRPVLNQEGAMVGGWKTMVEAVNVYTYGLGGDSEIRIDEQAGLMAGPRRLVPLSLLAQQFPEVLEVLRAQEGIQEKMPYRGQFALRQRPLDAGAAGLSDAQQTLWMALADGPQPLSELLPGPASVRALAKLVDRGLVVIAGLTPSDAAHVLGLQGHWCREAAEIGARLFLRRAVPLSGVLAADASGKSGTGWQPPQDIETLAHAIIDLVVQRSATLILDTLFQESASITPGDWGALGRYLVDRAASARQRADDLFNVALRLNLPLAAIGAPVGSYYPAIAGRLGARLVIPPHAEVTNAIGAVAGGIVQRAAILITAPQDGLYRAHLPDGIRDFTSLEAAAHHAEEIARREATALAARAGAGDIETKSERFDKVYQDASGLRIFMESTISATAFGRPSLAQRA